MFLHQTFRVFLRPFFYYTSSHPSNTYIYFTTLGEGPHALEGNRTPGPILEGSNITIILQALFLTGGGNQRTSVRCLAISCSDPTAPNFEGSWVLSIGGNRTLLHDFADHITNPYNAFPHPTYSGGNRTPATMLTALRSTIKLPNMTDSEGFEPPVPFGTLVFKTSTLNQTQPTILLSFYFLVLTLPSP
jgi:hypothetical protein